MRVPDYGSLAGAEVTNDLGENLGTIVGLFIDDSSSTPTWVAVRSGLFGRHQSLVPLAQSRWERGCLLVPYTRDDLAVAPHCEPDVALDADQEQACSSITTSGTATSTGLARTPGWRLRTPA